MPPNAFNSLESFGVAILNLASCLAQGGSLQKTYNMWLRLVEKYCIYRRLTFASDKLPAIAGLAAVFHQQAQDTYLAGIWRCDFVRGLFWSVEHNDYNKVTEHADRAPTWSWARWDGYIYFHLKYSEPLLTPYLATLLRYDIQPYNMVPFGRVHKGRVIIRAWVVHVSPDDIR
jgi:hypothetical protein